MTTGLPPTRRRPSREVVYLWVGAIVLVVSAPLWWYAIRYAGIPAIADLPEVLLLGVLLTAAFIAVEVWPLQIEVGRNTVLVTLSEMPLVIGLLTLPVPVVAAAALSAALLVFMIRRDRLHHITINTAFVAIETAIAAAAYVAAQVVFGADQGIAMASLLVAIPASTLVTALIVGETHRLTARREPVRSNILRSIVTSVSTTILALAGYTLYAQGTVGKVICVGLAAVAVVLYRTYSRFLRRHHDLAKLYEVTRQVAELSVEQERWPQLIEHIRDQFNAGVAVLVPGSVWPERAPVVVVADGETTRVAVPDRAGDALLQRASVEPVRISETALTDPADDDALVARSAREVMIVELGSGGVVLGHLELRDRRTRWGKFDDADLRLLDALGRQIAAAMDNGRLLDSLRYEAHHDTLTGLLNWRGLTVRAEEALERGSASAVMLLHLGLLPDVNNAIGHTRGDQLMVQAALRLAGVAGPDRASAHLDADRFAVVLEGVEVDHIETLAEQFRQVLDAPYGIEGVEVEPHARVGIAVVEPGMGQDAAPLLLQQAEMALTASESTDRPVRTYWAGMGEIFRRRFQLVTQFRRAVDDGAITVQYQPKMQLADRDVIGVEALVRWAHPEFGQVPPTEFVEAIEATGAIDVLLEHVLDTVLIQIAGWRRRGMSLGVAVNLSVRNLTSPDFPKLVAKALERHGVPARLLTLEITESSVMADPERYLPVLRELHGLGVQLSVDDFGTGYSSLAYLRRLPIDEIKIDKSFVQGMITDLGDLAIVRAIIDLGHSLGLRVVAEGVEEEAARDALRNLHCDELQGFLLARPMDVDRLEAWLTSRTVRVSADDGANILKLALAPEVAP